MPNLKILKPQVLQIEDGASYLMAEPRKGFITSKIDPGDFEGFPLAFLHGEIPPGCQIPVHSHDDEHEVFIGYKGEGQVVVDKDYYPFKPGTIAYAAPNQHHTLINNSDEPLQYFNIILTKQSKLEFIKRVGKPR